MRDLLGSAGPFPSTMTNVGLQIVLPILPIDTANQVALGVLNYTPDLTHLVAVPLVYTGPLGKGHFHRALGSLPFLIDRSRYCSARSHGALAALFRRKPKTMHILLQEYRFTEDDVIPFHQQLPRGLVMKRKSFILAFDEVMNVAGCKLVSFYPPWAGSSRSQFRWTVRVDEGVGWCFLIFRREEYAFRVCVQSPLSKDSREATASFGEVTLSTTVECLMKFDGGNKTTVSLPSFPSPRFELLAPERPWVKYVTSLEVDAVFRDWLHITCRAKYA